MAGRKSEHGIANMKLSTKAENKLLRELNGQLYDSLRRADARIAELEQRLKKRK